MADVTIIPSPPPQVQNVAGSGTQAPAAQASGLPAGSTVSGTIIGKDNSGNYVLRTDQGNLALKSSTPLTYNSDVTVRISSNANAGGTGARIISVNGTPFSEFSVPEEPTSDSVTTSLLSQTAATAQTEQDTAPQTASGIRATIIAAPIADSNAAPTSSATANTPQLVSGTSVTLRIAEVPQNVTEQAVVSTAAVPQTGTPANPASSSNAVALAQSQEISQTETPANVAQAVAPQAVQIQDDAQGANVNAAASEEPPANAATNASAANTAPAQTPSPSQPNQTVVTSLTTTTQETLTPSSESTAPANTPPPAQATTSATAQTTASVPANTPAASNTASTPQTAPTPTPQTTPTSTAQYAAYAKQPETSQPATQVPSTASTSQPAPIQAQVLTANSNGTVTLQTPSGVLTAKTDASLLPPSLTPGTNVTIELPESVLSAIVTGGNFSAEPASLSELSTSWPTLKDIANVAGGSPNASASNTNLLQRLPQMGQDFLSSSLAFIAAALQGDTRKILGDDVIDNLRQNNRTDLLEKFSGELSNVGQAFTQAQPRETPNWQLLVLPFMYQDELQQARLYIKRDAPKKERGANGKNNGDTRFVVEVDLSELGPLQMDGLVRTKEKNVAFDLVIRSHGPFSKEDQADIHNIYQQTSELTGFKGSLSFQVVRDFPVKPMEEIMSGTSRNIMA